MSKVLVLAQSGFGKSTSIGKTENEELGISIKGLDPANTYIISVTSKDLPFRGSKKMFPVAPISNLKDGRRVICNNAVDVEAVLQFLKGSPIKNIVIDDFNYLMQDWYMDNALAKGWEAPKQIGYFMGKIFTAIEQLDSVGKNVFVLAHGEPVPQGDGRTYLKMKTTGKMVDDYVTPEGKFDITLLGISKYDAIQKKVVKEYLTNENEMYSSAKSAPGMFDTLFIPNDLGIVEQQLESYYNGE